MPALELSKTRCFDSFSRKLGLVHPPSQGAQWGTTISVRRGGAVAPLPEILGQGVSRKAIFSTGARLTAALKRAISLLL